jgi:hypothetical protein
LFLTASARVGILWTEINSYLVKSDTLVESCGGVIVLDGFAEGELACTVRVMKLLLTEHKSHYKS